VACDTEAAATGAGLLFSTGLLGPAAATCDGAELASAVVGASGIGAGVSVPIAVETVACVEGAAADGSAATEEGGGATACAGGIDAGGDSTALVCAGGGATTAVEVAMSVVVTSGGACVVVVRIEVAAVRARERVHRRPLTVVIDSCGVAMQATGSMKETPARAQERRRREGKPSAAGALGILKWEIASSSLLAAAH
jgi:hypothetical protein